ncbi:DUF2147 domain-containing protein [Acinetobacter populi]|uniref:Signal peptidase n=1 Tax=Acinetobacter populi TaxID=1582270 RepID=A0A1Z9Z1S9_9GAMM|nr:DUF2147 domain-containing protein [Acinetobacter populi]OUY08399.1 signal peptidase [Acinetobacter populi]
MKLFKNILLLGSLLMMSGHLFAAEDITGKWRSIDDKTGFSKGIIEITKDASGVYTGKIIEVIPRPGYTPKIVCDQCTGTLKNKPILGLQILNNMKKSAKNDLEYEGGTILDPLNGKVYKSKIKLNSTGTRITMRGYVGVEVVGRSQTWIRQD